MLLSLISFTASYVIDDSLEAPSFLAAVFEKIFAALKFPILTLSGTQFIGSFFFFGLGINSLVYGFLIERLLFKKANTDED